jgi:uncharacterized membrane protein
MRSRLRIAGHPIHPMLVMFPLGLFATAVIFDAADLLGGPALLSEVAHLNLVGGLIGGVLASVAGLVDLAAVPNGTRAKRIGAVHGLINLGVILLFAVIWVVRIGADNRAAGGGLFMVELLALAAAGVGAWFGSQLIQRLGDGVAADPHLDVVRSLSGANANRIGHLGGVR